MAPFRAVGEVFDEYSDGGGRRSSGFEEKGTAERLMGFITLPGRLLVGFIMFLISSWSTSRNGFAFLKSVPVLGVICSFAGLLLLADFLNMTSEGARLAHNRGHLAFHSQQSPEHCEMFARNLIKLKPEPDYLYELGLAYDRNGQATEAYDVMRSLAPDNMLEVVSQRGQQGTLEITPGHSNAHIWLSQYYAKTRTLDISDVDRDKLVEQHLQQAVIADPENSLAQFNLAMLHLAEAEKQEKGSPDYERLARKTMEELESVYQAPGPLSRLKLMAMPKMVELKIELEDNDLKLQDMLRSEINKLEPKAIEYPDEVSLLLTMVRCAILMEDYPRALKMVRNGFQLAQKPSSKQRIMAMASMVYLEHASQYADLTNPIMFRGRIHTLAEAVVANPTERAIYIKLLDFVGTVPTEPGVINQEWLSDSVNGAKNPGIIHCLIGFKEMAAENFVAAEKHWRIAERQYPNARVIINNLMDVAASERPNEFKDLHKMISLAIEMFPDQPVFYRTRGVFLATSGRHEEAVKDLEYAAEKLPGIIDVHKHLILCYEKTGESEKELEQKEILEVKLNALGEAQRKRLETVIGGITH